MAANTNDFWDALTDLAKEKNISMDVLIETIENSLLIACKNNYGKAENASASSLWRLFQLMAYHSRKTTA